MEQEDVRAVLGFPSSRPGGPGLGRWPATTMTGTRPSGRWAPRREPRVPRRLQNQLSRGSHSSGRGFSTSDRSHYYRVYCSVYHVHRLNACLALVLTGYDLLHGARDAAPCTRLVRRSYTPLRLRLARNRRARRVACARELGHPELLPPCGLPAPLSIGNWEVARAVERIRT